MRNKHFFNKQNIITMLSVAGVVATSVISVKNSRKYDQKLFELEKRRTKEAYKFDNANGYEEVTSMDKIKIGIKTYAPAVCMGGATIFCILFSEHKHRKDYLKLSGAYIMLHNAFSEYRKAISKTYREEYKPIDTKNNEMIFCETYTNQYFVSTKEEVIEAKCTLNKLIQTQQFATLNDYCNLLHIDEVPEGDNLGWEVCGMYEMGWTSWVDIRLEESTTPDGVKCIDLDLLFCPYTEFKEDIY